MESMSYNETKIKKIGGKIWDDYNTIRQDIEYINHYYYPLLEALNLTDDISLIIKVPTTTTNELKTIFINKKFDDIDREVIPRLTYISPRSRKILEQLPPEKREKRWVTLTSRRLSLIFKDIYKQYARNYDLHKIAHYNKTALKIFREALFITPDGISIDRQKYVEIYISRMEASITKTAKQHELAAAALNLFFGGLEITHNELSKYFMLEYGKVKINPQSVNLKDYARLGYKGGCKQ